MPKFKRINDESEINLSNSWVNSPKFDSKDKIVNHLGKQYKLIAKKERSFSCRERVGRDFLGVLAVCCSLGCALFSKSIRNLFTREKEVIRFGIIHNPPRNGPTDKKIQRLIIDSACMESSPCKHRCTVTYIDGHEEQNIYDGRELKSLIAGLAPENVRNPSGNDHFSGY